MKTMLRCNDCDHIFEDNEAVRDVERHPLADGSVYVEPIWCCPACGSSSMEDVKECELCGEVHSTDFLHEGVCENCLYSHGEDFDVCLKIGESHLEWVAVNGFLASVLTESEIEAILIEAAREKVSMKPSLISNFIKQDEEWFAEQLLKGVKE